MFNYEITRRTLLGTIAVTPWLMGADDTQDWIELFNGHDMDGWRPSENKGSWTVRDGLLTANGPRSHLFYVGRVRNADFRNFDLEVELITEPDCNSGVYFHTTYQETGFPEKGFEVQVNNTARGEGGYLERKKTGSLYGLRNMYKQLVPDQRPFRLRIAVRGKNVQIRLNEELLVDYVEPTPPVIPAGGEKFRFLDHGTFALQCHNNGSRVTYRSVRVRPLRDDLPAYVGPPPIVDETYRQIINIGRHNLPMVDFHVYLREGLSLKDALRKSRRDGIQYGITADAASLTTKGSVANWLAPIKGKPAFFALATRNQNWTTGMSQEEAKQFDYVIAECGPGQPIAALVQRLNHEPIDVLSYQADFPPTDAGQVIEALVRNSVSLELNATAQSPNEQVILQAKEAGCKFAFGTRNATASELKRCEYGLRMVETCKLDWKNFFIPAAGVPKAVERRWPSQPS